MTTVYYLPGSIWGASVKETKHFRYFPPGRRLWNVLYDTKPGPVKKLTPDEINALKGRYEKC